MAFVIFKMGNIINSECLCEEDWLGEDCSVKKLKCPDDCS